MEGQPIQIGIRTAAFRIIDLERADQEHGQERVAVVQAELRFGHRLGDDIGDPPARGIRPRPGRRRIDDHHIDLGRILRTGGRRRRSDLFEILHFLSSGRRRDERRTDPHLVQKIRQGLDQIMRQGRGFALDDVAFAFFGDPDGAEAPTAGCGDEHITERIPLDAAADRPCAVDVQIRAVDAGCVHPTRK